MHEDRDPSEPSSDPIQAAWIEVESHWESAEAHRRFIGLSVALNCLPTAAKLYRSVRDTDEARKNEAERQLASLTAQAMSQLDLTRTPAAPRKSYVVWVGYGLSAFFLLYGLLSILRGHLR